MGNLLYIRNRMPAVKTPTCLWSKSGSRQSTNLTPHQGQHNYSGCRHLARRPDPAHHLGRALTATTMSVCSISLRKKIDWLTDDKWELEAGTFAPDGSQLPGRPISTATPVFTPTTSRPRAEALPTAAGRQLSRRQSHCPLPRRRPAALLPQWGRCSQRPMGLRPCFQAVAADYPRPGWRPAQR